MNQKYKIIGGKNFEQRLIVNIISYIEEMYSDLIKTEDLYEVEVKDKLSNDASGRSIEHKIFISREKVLNGIPYDINIADNLERNSKLKRLVSTIYHELWHVSTWEQYREIYEYITCGKEDYNSLCIAYSYMYWIEYIGHKETIFIEDYQTMIDFCKNFVNKRWEKTEYGYSDFVKSLPYYIVRACYLNEYESLTQQIFCKELRNATTDFKVVSEELFDNKYMNEIEKAKIIEDMIRQLLK